MFQSLAAKLNGIKAESLLAIGGSLIFLVAAMGFFSTDLLLKIHERELPPQLIGKSAFDIGQYYFNQDESATGPYDIEKAQWYYEIAIRQNPKASALLWYQSGRIDFINGDFNRALQKFNRQIAYFGDQVPNVYYMLGLTYGYKARISNDPADWSKAEENFKRAIEYFYEAPWPYVDLSWLYFSEGKYQDMKPLLETGLRYQANNPWLLNMYGLALLNTGDKAMAKEYFSFAVELTDKMDVEQWGKSYPGNDPHTWSQGLAQFKAVLARNLTLSEQ